MALGCSALLALTTGFEPLYNGNTNTYFARAVAQAEGGPLRADRLIRSADPMRVFSGGVRILMDLGAGEVVFYLLWVAAAMVFFTSLWWATTARGRSSVVTLTWAALLSLLAAPWMQPLTVRVRDRLHLGLPLPRDLLDGVAYQSALGPVLQPSVGAVALVAGIAVGIRRRNLLAAVGLM